MNTTVKIYFMIESKVYILTTKLGYKPVEEIYRHSLLEVADCMEEVVDFKIIAVVCKFPVYRNIEMQEECFHNFYEKEIKKIAKEWREEYNLLFGNISSIAKNKRDRELFFGELEYRLRDLKEEYKNILKKYNAEG